MKKIENEIPNLRETVLEWWNSINFETKFFRTVEWLNHLDKNTTDRHPDHLTGREIQEIYELWHKSNQE